MSVRLTPDDDLRSWRYGSERHALGRVPLVMGIVNVTPDSFSDGGQHYSTDEAVRHALQLVADGAQLLDVGGESTRPGSEPVPLDEELRRVIDVIRRLSAETDVPISIDTCKAEVARQALDAGARIVNDISGLSFDPEMPRVCADSDCGVVCMHIQGTPRTMQDDPHYDDVVAEVCRYFEERLATLENAGIDRERIALDPGIGFGKTAVHNLALLRSIASLRALGRPVLIGHSRKRFLKKILGRPVDERTFGTVGITVALAAQSTDIVRVHDVAANRDALRAWEAIVCPTADV